MMERVGVVEQMHCIEVNRGQQSKQRDQADVVLPVRRTMTQGGHAGRTVVQISVWPAADINVCR